MDLTREQKEILCGRQGTALAKCLNTLVTYGRVFGAQRLVPITSAHLAGSFRIALYDTYADMLQELVDDGVRVRVPTTVNPRPGIDFSLQNRLIFGGQRRLERALDALGVRPNYSCVCYLGEDAPGFGDVVAWAESSAIIFANSVLGARTNRNSIMIDVCSAVTGFTPEFGFLLDRNRHGQIRIQLDVEEMDAAALGILIGRISVDRVPVIDAYPFSTIELKNMGAAMAASGAVALFHVVGLTPEAATAEAVFDTEPEEDLTITQRDLNAVHADSAVQTAASIVAFGCPQMTLDEALAVGARFKGSRVSKRVVFHLIPAARDAFLAHKVGRAALAAGIEVVTHCPLASLSLRLGLGNTDVLTPSGKLGCYLEGARYATLDKAIAACDGHSAESGF